MLHLAHVLLGGRRRDAHHRRKVAKNNRLTEETLEWLPKFTLTLDSIEDIRRPHTRRQHLAVSQPIDSCPATALDGSDSCYTSEGDKPACVVCLEEYVVGQDVRVLHCGHVFHDECISRWLVLSKAKFHECPICKTPCFPDEVVQKAEDDANRRSPRHSHTNLVSVF